MTDDNGKESTKKSSFASNVKYNIVKSRGNPTKAVILSGHEVEKQETLYFKIPQSIGGLVAGTWVSLKCADYHNEHFIYIDPVYLEEGPQARGHWFAMCTCGSAAIIIEAGATESHDSAEPVNMLVCKKYMDSKTTYGVGVHLGQEQRRWL